MNFINKFLLSLCLMSTAFSYSGRCCGEVGDSVLPEAHTELLEEKARSQAGGFVRIYMDNFNPGLVEFYAWRDEKGECQIGYVGQSEDGIPTEFRKMPISKAPKELRVGSFVAYPINIGRYGLKKKGDNIRFAGGVIFEMDKEVKLRIQYTEFGDMLPRNKILLKPRGRNVCLCSSKGFFLKNLFFH